MIRQGLIFYVVTFLFLFGCAPDHVEPVIDKDGYYARVVELLDPDNPNPPVAASEGT